MAVLGGHQPHSTSSGLETKCVYEYCGMRRPMLAVTVRALHMCVSGWLSQLKNPEPEGMVWQRLVL